MVAVKALEMEGRRNCNGGGGYGEGGGGGRK